MDYIIDQLKGVRINICCVIDFTGNTVLKIVEEMHSFGIRKCQLQFVGG